MADITDAGPRLRQMNDALTGFDQMRAEIERLRAEIERLRGRVVRLPWTRGDWAGTVDMIAYRGMVADALDAAGVKWEMADG